MAIRTRALVARCSCEGRQLLVLQVAGEYPRNSVTRQQPETAQEGNDRASCQYRNGEDRFAADMARQIMDLPTNVESGR